MLLYLDLPALLRGKTSVIFTRRALTEAYGWKRLGVSELFKGASSFSTQVTNETVRKIVLPYARCRVSPVMHLHEFSYNTYGIHTTVPMVFDGISESIPPVGPTFNLIQYSPRGRVRILGVKAEAVKYLENKALRIISSAFENIC